MTEPTQSDRELLANEYEANGHTTGARDIRSGSYITSDEQAALRAIAKARLGAINTPETADFVRGVTLEAAHQVERWGASHDRSKSAENWFWLVGYLAGKALRASVEGDREKALHHTISAAAALSQWHAAISADQSGRGLGNDEDMEKA